MYLINISNVYPDSYWLGYDSEKFPDTMCLTEGQWVDPELFSEAYFFTQSRLSIKNLLTYDYLFTVGPNLLSERLATIFSTARGNTVQLIPTKIKHKEDFYSGFYIPNYLVVKDAFDAEQCESKPLLKDYPDGPRSFRRIVLRKSNESNLIFRAQESRGEIIMTDDLARKIEKLKPKGIRLVKDQIDYSY